MTDTGQIPGEGLPENAGMVEQPGIPAPDAYTFLDPSEHTTEDDDLLLMPTSQGAWSDPQAAPAPAPGQPAAPAAVAAQPSGPEHGAQQPQPQFPAQQAQAAAAPAPAEPHGTHESGGRDSGSVDLNGVRIPAPAPAPVGAHAAAAPARRPLHRGPAAADPPSYGGGTQGGVVRSLADRGPAGATRTAPARHAGPPTTGPEYFDVPAEDPSTLPGPQLGEIPPQAGAPWGAQPPQAQPETVPVPAEAVEQAVQPEQLVEAAQPVAEPEVAAEPAAAAEAAQPVAEVEQPVETVPPVQAAEPVTVSAPAAPADQPEQLIQPEQPEQPIQPEQLSEQPVQPAAVTQPEPAVQSEPVAQAEPAPQSEPDLETEPAPQAVPAETVVPEQAAVELPPAGPVVVPEPEAAQPETRVEAPVQPLADEVPPAPEAPAPEAEAQAAPVHAAAPESQAPAPEQPVAEPVVQPDPVAQPEQELPVEPAPEPAPEPVLAVTPVAAPEPVAAPLAPEPVQPQPAAELPAEPAEQLPVTEQEAAPAPEPAEATTAETADGTADGAADATAAAHVAAPDAEDGTGPEVIETPELPEPLEPELAERTPATAPQQPQTDAPQNTGTADSTDSPQQPQTEPAPQPEESAEASTPPAPGYDDAEREAVLRVMRERRDIRNGFRSDPIPHEVLLRVLEAAHTAPSVGHSQPWDFVVIRSAETRRSMHELAQSQRDAYAKSLPKGRAKQFKELKIEAILDTPVNIVVTADPTRGGRHTLGRHTQPQMAPYSSALAVENLWLAARAEGLGVGWVSFFDEREMVRALGLPEHLEVVAYLCVGYVDEFPEEPELMQAGWSKRRPLSWVVHEETYGRRALPGAEPHDLLQETISAIRPLDAKALGEAWERQKRMTKPAGALGMLEIISAQLSGLSRMCPPPIPEPAAVAIFAGDHGVHAQGVTAWPQEVTAQMVANFLGGGAVCNAFAAQVGAEVCVVDVGVATDLPATPGLLPRKVRPGTADFTTGPALTREEVLAAIEVGIETARDLVAAGNKALLTGEMGIANTTASAALICVYTGIDASEVTGRGTGINDEMHARKVDVVRRALDLHQPDASDPIGVLAAVGGLEHAAMAGFLLGGASLRTPVVLDGVSAGAAALVARAIAPEALAACIAGHRSAEPGHVAALNKLGLRPLVDLDLRLGEGTGALLALPIVQSAARAMHEVATFDSAGVTEK
ncbi:nicotinate-nucleotide--dimethylbenzimidazole phosphoribosyltransferase [Streptomyces sp. ATCC51928]|uniref:Nicotinate-nucleotide--dimethylbenzimidazole phosphoribosyltransferase n=1 Tax=Streptomyces caviscabies TaxID=90079 RepID=A0ABW2MN23_9ACTN|nr:MULTISPECIES: nicotinate-nucleotide--dimethylbenzimidazole phosphoribosyltransferase [unclassified Streptomyces]MDX3505629.1 nicotinate-nucleotide--dimethylbenzimidazole phosphoribosyltransferase [Streptomyces sp. ATCC51928]MDX5525052.1 nicotinate-nucleotide--dimethylbenzimidazole phosphoribosyltransferase [Streptomyces sp. DE06-01C]